MDFLNKLEGFTIDLQKNQLINQNRKIRVPKQGQVKISTDTIIPAKNEIFMLERAESITEIIGKDYIFIPREMRDSEIEMAPSLVRIKDGKIPIIIVNFSNKPKIIKPGMIIGNLQRAKIEINAMESSKPEQNRYKTMLKDSTHLSKQEKRELENVLL